MGDMATLRMARQELEDLYLGVPDDSVDLTFKDLAFNVKEESIVNLPLPLAAAGAATPPHHAAHAGGAADKLLARSSTNIFTYRPILEEDMSAGGGGLLQLPLSPPPGLRRPHDDDQASSAAVAGDRHRHHHGKPAASQNHRNFRQHQRPGIPHSSICALCNKYVYFFRHRCLVCGRLYCRRCVGDGMGDMTEGRKCVDCLGRRYSHRYIHRAGDASGRCCPCFWGFYPNAKAVTAQELIWAEKGPAPRRRPHHRAAAAAGASSSSSIVSSTADYNSASMSMTINSDNSITGMNSIGGMPASASSSFVASYAPNPHAFPL